jgi:DNA processing protein
MTAGHLPPQPQPGSADRYARAALSFLADPGDEVLGTLLRFASAAHVLDVVTSGCPGPWQAIAGPALARLASTGSALGDSGPGPDPAWPSTAAADRVIGRWRARLPDLPSEVRLAAWQRGGYRLVCPGDPEWPTQLDDLGDKRPVVLWLYGEADLRFCCLRSVSVVGSRAATAYGTHVATDLGAELAARSWSVISGGAYGVDASAHRGAMAVGGITIAVLASGLTFGYPKGHDELFSTIAGHGLMVSECPPDRAPTRPGFLVRNRVIAALSRGTVVVEAARRSGALNTAKHARDLNRHVMAVPGPITSEQSAGCHDLIREWGATCVTGVSDVIELVAPLGEGDQLPVADTAVHASILDPVTAEVLAAVTKRSGRGPATIAVLAGVDLDTALRCLGLLAAAGCIERCDQGWRVRRAASQQ